MLTTKGSSVKHERLFFSVFEVISLLQKDLLRMDLRMDDGELSKLHLGTLGVLSRYPELTVTALADKLHLVKPQMSLVLDKLEGLGLSTRERCTEDRRQYRVSLTDLGEARLATALRRMDEALPATLSVLGKAEVNELRGSLASIARILGKLSPAKDAPT